MMRRLFRSWSVAAATLGVVATLAGFVFAVWLAPRMIAREVLADPVSGAADREKAVHDARVMVISLGGGLVVVTGLLYTARNYRLNHRGQITDRFTKALERIGSDELYIRIGGIHALEHVMHDSPEFGADVVQVLVSFIRARTPRHRARSDTDTNTNWMHPPGWTDDPELPDEPLSDVQAALGALARRPSPKNYGNADVNLRGLHLRGAGLFAGRLAGVDLRGADLTGSQLSNADLSGAWLTGADLTGAELYRADLTEAALDGAHLNGVRFGHANLTDTDLFNARLDRANFRGARLGGALFVDAQLGNANFRDATLIGAIFDGARLQQVNFRGANLQRASFSRADLSGASFVGANLAHAQLDGADLTDAILCDARLAAADFEDADFTRTTIAGYIHDTNITLKQLSQSLSGP